MDSGDLEKPLMNGENGEEKLPATPREVLRTTTAEVLMKRGDTPSVSSFRMNLGMAVRTSLCCTLVSLPVFVPSWNAQLTASPFWGPYMGLVPGNTVLMIVFTVYGDYGSTVQLFYQGAIGTLWACIWAHVMFALMPGGAAGDHFYAPVAHASHILFVFLSMWFNVSKNVRMFILSYQVFFAADLLNPNNADVYNTGWPIGWTTYTTTTMITAVWGVIFALFVPLLPYPIFAKKRAANAAHDTVDSLCACMEGLCKYFSGDKPSVVITAKDVEIEKVSDTVNGLPAAISGMWWETFDLGKSGLVRQLLTRHAAMLRTLCDNMMAMHICIAKEDFGSTHADCMATISDAAQQMCMATRTLLEKATLAASDGHIDDKEKDELEGLVQGVQKTVQELSVSFNKARKSVAQALVKKQEAKTGAKPGSIRWDQQVINEDLQSESFFVYCLCAYARLATEYSYRMIKKPPPKPNFVKDVFQSFMSTFEPKLLIQRLDIHGAPIRGTIELIISFYIGMYWFNYNAAAACAVSLLVSEFTGSALQKNMGRIQAVVIGALVPHILYQIVGTSCHIAVVGVKITVFFLFEVLACYIYYSSASFGYIGCLVAAFSCSVLIYPCGHPGTTEDAFDIASFTKMTNTILGVIVMTIVDMCLASERASTSASKNLIKAMTMLDAWFQGMFLDRMPDSAVTMPQAFKCRADITDDHENAKSVIKNFRGSSLPSSAASALEIAAMYGVESDKEPRYHRSAWPSDFFQAQIHESSKLRHNLCVIEQVLMGIKRPGVVNYGSFASIRQSQAWNDVKSDVTDTLGNCLELVQAVLNNEFGKTLDIFKEKMGELEGADQLESMSSLFKAINSSGLTYPADASVTSMEDDEICRLNVILMLFTSSVEHVAGMIKECLKQI